MMPQPGHMLGLILMGVLLLSALLYYREVKVQRYLEPSLAIAQPRIEFNRRIRQVIEKEFGSARPVGLIFSANSIFVEDALIFRDPAKREVPDPAFMARLSQVFLSILGDPEMRLQFDLILIGTSLPLSPHVQMNRIKRFEMQHIAESIMDALYNAEPEIEKNYKNYFASTAIPVLRTKSDKWVEFRIIPNEHLHTEMIKSLEKYFF